MCNTRIQRSSCFLDLGLMDSVQSPVAIGLSLEGTAGFSQKLREAVAASCRQLKPVYRHPVILHGGLHCLFQLPIRERL